MREIYPERHWRGNCQRAFRATGITAYLEAGGTLEKAQEMAAHESPRTKLYDRTGDEITLDEVERITILRVNLQFIQCVITYS